MKKIIMSIIVAILCISLCACEKAKQNLNSEDKLSATAIQMKINIYEATIYLSDSNNDIINSIYAMQAMDRETSIVCFKKALELVKDVKTRVDVSISSPNFISKELGELEEIYEETIILLSRFSELSEEEINEVINLIEDGTSKHILLLKSLNAFSCLYEIREFDQLPDDKAQSSLEDSWWKFGFNDNIECPETIDEQDLYLIWAKQFFENFDEDKFLEELQILRENDDLSSQECNQKWTEFIENFITKAEEGSYSRAPSFAFVLYPNGLNMIILSPKEHLFEISSQQRTLALP